MSIKYLSSSGLTEVWSNIKAYIASKIPSKIITGLSINGKTITYTNSDGTIGTLTTQDTNTDTKVTQTVTTTNAEYPVLFSTDANKTATSTTTARFSSNIKINPNTNTITATTFKGNLSGTATKATQDASGNVIADTYATKSELNAKADDANVVHKSGTEIIVGTKTFSKPRTKFYKSLDLYHNEDYKLNTNPSKKVYQYVFFTGKSGWYSAFLENQVDTDGASYCNLLTRNTNEQSATIQLAIDSKNVKTLKPDTDNDISLGTSANKWKAVYATTFNGNLVGNANTATKATNNASGNELSNNIIKGLSVKGKVITYTKLDGSTGTITTQDTTYSSMSAAEATTGTATAARTISPKVLHDKINSNLSAYATKTELNTKANDSAVVHISGNETIDGLKTFSTWQIIDRGLNVSWITGNKEQKSLFLFSTMDDGYQGYGAELKLHSEILNGGFELTAKDKTGTNVKTLIGDSNGSLTWEGKTVLTAGNGVTLDTVQIIPAAKTFASWATFSYGINVKWITGNKEQKSLHLFGSMNDNYEGYGAKLELHGDDANYGMFALIAKDETNTNVKRFVGWPNGLLTWGGKKVLTEDNGVTVDTAQTISGNKTFTGQTTFIGHNLFVKNPTVDLLHSTDSSWVGAGITGTDKNNVRIGFFDFYIGANDCAFKVFCRNRQNVEKEVFYAGINTNGAFGVVDGRHIVRTVNGIGANQAGNVNLTNILGFTPVQQGGGKGQLGNKIYIGWSGSQLKCTVDKTDLGAFVFEGGSQVGTTITAYWGSSSSTGNKWETVGGLHGTKLVSSTTSTFTPVVGQIYSGNQLYSTVIVNGGVGATDEPDRAPKAVYACLSLSGAFNSSYKYLCTTAVGLNATASVYVTGHTASDSSGPYTTITGYSGFTKTGHGGKSTFLRVQ